MQEQDPDGSPVPTFDEDDDTPTPTESPDDGGGYDDSNQPELPTPDPGIDYPTFPAPDIDRDPKDGREIPCRECPAKVSND